MVIVLAPCSPRHKLAGAEILAVRFPADLRPRYRADPVSLLRLLPSPRRIRPVLPAQLTKMRNNSRRRSPPPSALARCRPGCPTHGYGDFANETRLTDDEIRLIVEWAKSGAPQGPPVRDAASAEIHRRLAARPSRHDSRRHTRLLRARLGTRRFLEFYFLASAHRQRYVRAIEVRPGIPHGVHHANRARRSRATPREASETRARRRLSRHGPHRAAQRL